MDKLFYYSSIAGGILLAATLIWVAIYNLRSKATGKAIVFLILGLSLGMLLIYNILFK